MNRKILLAIWLMCVMLAGCTNSNQANPASETTDTALTDVHSVTEESGYENGGYTSFVCEKTGSYYFELRNPTNTVWKIYLLDEQWLEAPRFIGQAYQPCLKLDASFGGILRKHL